MKKISKDSPKVSVEHSMTETKQEHKIIDQNQSDFENMNKIDLIGNEYTHQSNADQQKYFRISLFTIPPEKKDEFIVQSDSFKKEVRKRLGGGILSAYMIQTERDKILLVGIYDSIENAVKGKIVADEIFLEMDAKFITAPIRVDEGPVVYEVNY